METKKELRSHMTFLRNQIQKEERLLLSERIFDRLCQSRIYLESPVIYSYVSFRSEVDTTRFNERVLKDGKQLALPKVVSKTDMEFFFVEDVSRLVPGYMGIMEPAPLHPAKPSEKCLMVLPGLAFDRGFGRLGYGGGYYDRYVNRYTHHFYRCGICYDLQLIPEVPRESHDLLMDYIVTEYNLLERMKQHDA